MFKKYHYVPQIDMRDCGIAALSSIIQHYGSYYSLAYLRQLAQTTMEGTSALGIIKASETLCFDAQAVQADMSLFSFDDIPFPFIVHVNKNQKIPHYYVVYGISNDKIIIGDPDPSVKIVRISKERFASEWTGTAILIAPGENYQIFKEKKHGLLSFIPKLKKHAHLVRNIILLSFLITIISIIGSYYLQQVLDYYIPEQVNSILDIVSLGLVITYIIQQVFFYFKNYLLEKLSLELTSELFIDYLKHIFDLPMDFFSTRRTGEVISRFTDATTIIDALASTILSLFLDFTILLIVGGFMFSQNKILFLITLGIIPLYTLVIFLFIPYFEKLNNEVMHENAILNSSLIEDINGIETIKSLTGEELRFDYLRNNFSKFLDKSLKLNKFEVFQTALKQVIHLILNLIILWYGAKLVIKHEMSIGQLITYATLLAYFITPLDSIIGLQTKLQAARVANNRLNEVYLVQSEHINSSSNNQKILVPGKIVVQDLTYQYGFNSPTLKEVSLTIQPGEKVCFLGKSGSGKTTLAKLFVRFFEPTSGKIFMSGESLETIDKRSLRQHINYLPQSPYIFNGSILDNLTLGLSNISHDKIIEACRISEILSDIQELPLEFKTEISSSAVLSGGQKQRLALARALLTEAPILILDEVTSNLDIATEQRVIHNLLQLTDKTIIFIAHRLTVAEQSDNIFILENGNIVEQGSHSELVKKEGIYYQLLNV